MATADIKAPAREDWVLANPWPYAAFGLVSALLALLLTRLAPDSLDFPRGFFLLAALGAGGLSLVLRLNSARSAFIDDMAPAARSLVLQTLGVLFALIAVLLTVLWIGSWFGARFVPWRPGSLTVVWIVIAPICFFAARACLGARGPDKNIPWGYEAACLLLLFALTCMAGSWSLYFGKESFHDWRTMRLFLSVAAFAAFAAAPFYLVGAGPRRIALVLLFLLHFGGIMSAALSQPPYPWIVGQLWVRIYRPYLEFMYLNNAYHFYAPEPDAATYMYFRMIYEDGKGRTDGVWYKIPEIDDKGWHKHTVALEYQRYLSFTTNVAMASSLTIPLVDNSASPFGNPDDDAIVTYGMTGPYKARWRKSPFAVYFQKMRDELEKEAKDAGVKKEAKDDKDKKDQDKTILGKLKPENGKDLNEFKLPAFNFEDYPGLVPFHPSVALTSQYAAPTQNVQHLVESFVRHISTRPHPDHPDWKLRSVKVYKVKHELFGWDQMLAKRDPTDPVTFSPWYMGEYDPNGVIVNRKDPFLFWMLPILRNNYSDPSSPLSLTLSFMHRHAGDPKWAVGKNAAGEWEWYAPRRELLEQPR
ncbi:MAG: hypothetical protein U0793_32735 [Gemmataceae bacterium]